MICALSRTLSFDIAKIIEIKLRLLNHVFRNKKRVENLETLLTWLKFIGKNFAEHFSSLIWLEKFVSIRIFHFKMWNNLFLHVDSKTWTAILNHNHLVMVTIIFFCGMFYNTIIIQHRNRDAFAIKVLGKIRQKFWT